MRPRPIRASPFETLASQAPQHEGKDHNHFQGEKPMSFYDATVPLFTQMLTALTGIINKAEAHCQAKGIQPDVLLSARLYPDMLPFTKQIQLACDFAAKSTARLAHVEVPSTADTEKSFDELRQRLARTI